jgi:tyrosyl-tRNA synthetase
VVTRYHGAGTAKSSLAEFRRTFTDRGEPTDMPAVVVDSEVATALDLLRAARPSDSNSELRRLLRQGAVSINGVRTEDAAAAIDLRSDVVLKSGARTWHRITRQ